MTHLSASQQAQIDNRDASGRWTVKTHGDVEDTAGTLGLVNAEQSSSPDSHEVSPDETGFGAELHQVLPEGVSATVHQDGDGGDSYVIGDGRVTVSRTPERAIDLGNGTKHHIPARLTVDEHTASGTHTVISAHEDPRMDSYTAIRAVEHYEALAAGRDPLDQARRAEHHRARAGMPASYGFDIGDRSTDTQTVARDLVTRFEDEDTEVTAYDSGGGNEIIGVRGTHPDTGRGYEVMVSSRHGGGLDDEGWAVGADYEADGDWGHSDLADLYETGHSSSATETTEAVASALKQARDKAGQ